MVDTTEASAVPHCSFCGVEKTDELPLIAGNDGFICEQCVKLAHQVVHSWGRQAPKASPELKTPAAIKAFLDDYIIGQDGAKKTLSVGVFNHYLRLMNQNSQQTLATSQGDGVVELEKSNMVMVGPSGTGKTLLVKTLARIIGVPFVIGDATSLTQAGYVGDDVDSLLKRLLEAAEGDIKQAQWGIVYIDEIDKLAKPGSGGAPVRDISGEGVQQALLKMVEGNEVKLPKSGRRDGQGEEITLDTRNVLFIVGGAFPGLTELVSGRLNPKKTGIGFNAKLHTASEVSNDQLLAGLQPEDLQKFGLIPEFIGRFPIVTFLQELDVDSLCRILQEPRNALVKQYQQLFAFQNVKLEFDPAALRFIAEKAVNQGTGARGLRAIMENLLRETMFDLPSDPDCHDCRVVVQHDPESDSDVLAVELGAEAAAKGAAAVAASAG